jgi:hypothetical protein
VTRECRLFVLVFLPTPPPGRRNIILAHSLMHLPSHTTARSSHPRMKTAEERLIRANDQFVDADLQRNGSWNAMYRRLIKYRDERGEVLVLQSKDSTPDIKKLSKWVQNQRVHYKYYTNGDTKHIKKHRIDALKKVCTCLYCLFSSSRSFFENYNDD